MSDLLLVELMAMSTRANDNERNDGGSGHDDDQKSRLVRYTSTSAPLSRADVLSTECSG